MQYKTFKDIITESVKRKNVKVLSYGKDDGDFSELQVWLSSDDIISISHDKEDDESTIKNWGADYYSWMDDNIEIEIDNNGKKTVILSSYDSDKDVGSWKTVTGLQGTMKKMKKYGSTKNVYVIPMDTNTKDIKLTITALVLK